MSQMEEEGSNPYSAFLARDSLVMRHVNKGLSVIQAKSDPIAPFSGLILE
jgi:hypothetical protein